MVLPGPEFNVGLSARMKLVDKLRAGNPVLTYREDPALASLCTCLALQFETGNAQLDRLSPFFGVAVDRTMENPWLSQLFSRENEIGICFWLRENDTLSVKHPDFKNIISADSFNEQGEFTRIVIYPSRVAEAYQTMGFELVIVRDWILATALQLETAHSLSYLYVNSWEVKANIALRQISLMKKRQLPFFGTHDVVDHLLGADRYQLEKNSELFEGVDATLNEAFDNEMTSSIPKLCISYVVGVLLDDLAQPKWYESKSHRYGIELALSELRAFRKTARKNARPISDSDIQIPKSFHQLIETVRKTDWAPKQIKSHFDAFRIDITTNPLF